MLLDILAVLVVSLISSLLLCTTSLHGLPPPATPLRYIHNHPTAESFSSLRHLRHHHLPSVDDDVGGDDSEMLIGESNESSTNGDDDDSSSSSSADAANEPYDLYFHTSSKSLSRKLLSPQHQFDQRKRSSSPSVIPSSLPTNFKLNSAVDAAALVDKSKTNSAVNLSQLSESTRLSPSLKIMVETNPFARAWLALLLQKMMQEQPVPYIFKYGRRRKK